MRLPALMILACATACATRHVTLPRGRAEVIARWRVSDALPLGDGRIIVAGGPSSTRGAPLVACLHPDGDIDWRLTAFPAEENPTVRIAVSPRDRAVWVLAYAQSGFTAERPVHDGARTTLTRIDRDGKIEAEVASPPLEGRPFYVGATPDGGAIAVMGTRTGLGIVRVARDGAIRYGLDHARGAVREPSDVGLPVVGAIDGDTLWLAGAGTALYVAMPDRPDIEAGAFGGDGTYHGPTVLAIDLASGMPRRLYALETRLGVPGGWGYPSGLAFAGGKLVLARRNGSDTGRITVHDPSSLRAERTLFATTTGTTYGLVTDGADVLLGLVQSERGTVTYGDRSVATNSEHSSAAITLRLALDGRAPSVLGVAIPLPIDGDILGGVGAPIPVLLGDHLAIVGSFSGDLLVDGLGPLSGSRSRDGGITSAYLVRVRR
jgi:hypothetical protein